LKNAGSESQIVDVSTFCPASWYAEILSGSYIISQVSLAAGQSMSLQLQVTVPSTASVNGNYVLSLMATGVTSSSLNFTVIVGSQSAVTTSAMVSGIIVDETGNAMINVEVTAFSANNTFVNSTCTSADGSFSLQLLTEQPYTIKASKDGYKDTAKTVILQANAAVTDIGELTLAKNVKLISSIVSIVTNSGDNLILPFTISNTGSTTEDVTLSASAPSGWSTKISDSSSIEVTGISLQSNNMASFQLSAKVPLDVTGSYTITITAVSEITTTLTFHITVASAGSSFLFCPYPGVYATLGSSAKFDITLVNPFSTVLTFDVWVESIPANWSASIKSASGTALSAVTVSAQQSVDLVVQVDSIASATTDQTYQVMFKAAATRYNITDGLPLSVSLTEAANEVTITTSLPEIAISAGDSATYSATVANLGISDRFLFLSSQPPSGWTVSFNAGNSAITSLYLYASNTSALTVTVTPPSSVNVGSYNIPIQVKSETGAVLAELNLTTTVTGSYSLSLYPSTYAMAATSGQSASFTATVTNTGYTTLTDIVVNVTLPEDWTYTISPPQVDHLGPRESATFNVNVKIPDNTVAGDYMVNVMGSCSQTQSSQSQVRFTVSASTSWGIYGIVIAIVFIVALVLVFRKFRRR